MPWPIPGEKKSDYVSRFMKSGEAQADYKDPKQRVAVAYGMFKEKHPKKGLNGLWRHHD